MGRPKPLPIGVPRRRPPRAQPLELPIVDERARIVGWTTQIPSILASELRHEQAEALVGPIAAWYVELRDPEAQHRAGAPPGWKGPWRCLALCSAALTERHSAERLIVKVETSSALASKNVAH